MIAGALEIQLFANLARLSRDMSEAKTTVARSMKGIESAVASAKSALAALGVGLSVGYFVTLIKGSIDAADRLNDLSKSTNITVENLAGLKLAAKQSGGDLDSIAAAINKLSQNMGKDADKFKALGVTAKEPLEAFKQLSDIFVAIQDPQLRAAVAAQALGKSWAGAAPLLAEGGRRIAEIVENGKRLSGMTKEMVVNADDFNDKMAELSTTLESTKTKLVADMLPGMKDIADAMREAAKEGGVLLTIWVAMGGAMAHLLGLTDNQKMASRLKEINDEIERAQKQMQSGSTNPGGIFGWFVPDVKVSEAALSNLRKTIEALKAERASLMPPTSAGLALPGANTASELVAKQAAAEARARQFLTGDKEAKLAAAELMKYENALKSLEDQLGKMNDMTVEQKMVNDLARGSLKGLTEEHQRLLIAKAREVDIAQVAKVAREAYVKTMEMDLALEQEIADLMAARATKEGDAIKAQHKVIEDLQFEASLIGKTNAERETAIALRALEASSSAKVSGGIDKESAEYARLEKNIRQAIQAKTAAEALNPKVIEQLEFETKLLGLNNTQREQAIAIRALELSGVDQTTDAYKAYVAQLKNVIAAKTAADEMKALHVGMWQDIDRVAHDTFTSIFDSGKSTFDRLRDTLKNGLYSLLYQLTLKPILINIATTVGGAGVAQQAFGAAGGGGGGGILNALSTGNSIFNALRGGSSMATNLVGNTVAGAGFLGASPMFGAVGGAELAGLAALEGGGIATAGMGAMGAIGAALPYIGIALAAASALGLFGKGKTPAVGQGHHLFGSLGAGGLDIMSEGLTNKGTEAAASQLHNAIYVGAFKGLADDLETLLKPIIGGEAAKVRSTTGTFDFSQGMNVPDPETAAKMVLYTSESIIEQLVPGIRDLQKENEALVETAARLSAEMKLTDDILELVGDTAERVFGGVGAASLKLRDDLVELMGGLQNATALSQSYYANFFAESERLAIDLGRVNAAMMELGVSALPTTRAEFRLLVEAQDLSTRAGTEMFAALMQLAPAFAAVTPVLDGVIEAVSEVSSAWKSATDSIMDEVRRIRGLIGTDAGSNAMAMAQFAISTAQARAGDVEAARLLPELSRAVIEMSLRTASDALDVVRKRSQIASSLETTMLLAGHAGGGIASGWSMVGERGPELVDFTSPGRVYTAADSRAMLRGGNDPAMLAELRALRAEVAALRKPTEATAANTRKTADTTEAVTRGDLSFKTEEA